MSSYDAMPDVLLKQAHGGDEAALGRLLELYRNYLRLVARAMIGQALRVRLDASDLVQETFLKAHREFRQFLGSTEPELTAWLRQILVRTLANQARHHRREGRDYQRQEPLEAMLDRSSRQCSTPWPRRSHRPAPTRSPRAGRPAGRRAREIARRLSRGVHPA